MTRDNIVWWFGIVGSILVGLSLNLDAFPWMSETARHWITFGAFMFGIISGKLASSPLKHSEEKKAEEAAGGGWPPIPKPLPPPPPAPTWRDQGQ